MILDKSSVMASEVIVTVPLSSTGAHPTIVYTTVYVVLVVGDTVILCVVYAPGDQSYVPPVKDGVAVSMPSVPEQTEVLLTDRVAGACTVTVS